MREIITFFIKLAVFVTLIALFVFGVVLPQYAADYTASLVDKYERLSTLDGPKIILVGDSNVAFGLDSAMIQDALGMPVVNFGLHGGLGIAFHSDVIKPYISEGDIVIALPCNYESDLDLGNPALAWTGIESNISIIRSLPPDDIVKLVKAFPTHLRASLIRWTSKTGNSELIGFPYCRAVFNEFGDNDFPREACVMEDGQYGSSFSSKELSLEHQDYWNEYAAFVKERNAALYMSCPPILETTLYEDSETVLNHLQYQLETKLSFPMISSLRDYVYPLEYFYDTGLHLNDQGKVIRTAQLIEDLMPYLEKAS